MYIQHITLCEFENNENATEIAKKICNIDGQGIIIDCQVRNWFSKFYSGKASLTDEPRPGFSSNLNKDALRELMDCNLCKSTQELALDLHTYQIYYLLPVKKIEKMSKLDVWVLHTLREKRKEDCRSITI